MAPGSRSAPEQEFGAALSDCMQLCLRAADSRPGLQDTMLQRCSMQSWQLGLQHLTLAALSSRSYSPLLQLSLRTTLSWGPGLSISLQPGFSAGTCPSAAGA